MSPSPPLFVPGPLNERLWHLAFNRLAMVNEDLVRGREDIFFGAEYAAWAGTPLPDEVVKYYIGRLASDPEALRGSFELYRALDVDFAQSEERKTRAADNAGPGVASSVPSVPKRERPCPRLEAHD